MYMGSLMKIPDRIIQLINQKKIIYSLKTQNFLENSFYSYKDATNTIHSGYIQKKERDEKKEGQYKYTIAGQSCNGVPMYLVGKIVSGYFVIITFHERR